MDNYYTVAATNSLNVCPTRWHVPSKNEWTILSNFLVYFGYGFEGSGPDIGKSMESTFRWTAYSTPGTVGNDQGTNNSCGFAGLPGGTRYNGAFDGIGYLGVWWSSTENSTNDAWVRFLWYDNVDLNNVIDYKSQGYYC